MPNLFKRPLVFQFCKQAQCPAKRRYLSTAFFAVLFFSLNTSFNQHQKLELYSADHFEDSQLSKYLPYLHRLPSLPHPHSNKKHIDDILGFEFLQRYHCTPTRLVQPRVINSYTLLNNKVAENAAKSTLNCLLDLVSDRHSNILEDTWLTASTDVIIQEL